jgi:hypothetical protein
LDGQAGKEVLKFLLAALQSAATGCAVRPVEVLWADSKFFCIRKANLVTKMQYNHIITRLGGLDVQCAGNFSTTIRAGFCHQ